MEGLDLSFGLGFAQESHTRERTWGKNHWEGNGISKKNDKARGRMSRWNMSTFAGSKGRVPHGTHIKWSHELLCPQLGPTAFPAATWQPDQLHLCECVQTHPFSPEISLRCCQTGPCKRAGLRGSSTVWSALPSLKLQGRTGTLERSGAQRLRAIGLIQMSLWLLYMCWWFLEREKAGAWFLSSCHWLLCPEGQAEGKQRLLAKVRVHSRGNFCLRRSSVVHSRVSAGWTQDPSELGCAQSRIPQPQRWDI